MTSLKRAKEIIKKSKKKPVLACGDVMLDAYLAGTVERLSQEAPVPIISVEDEKFFPGGAGNAAACMSAIGMRPFLISVVGSREKIPYREILLEKCKESKINPLFITDPKRKTTLKLRLAGIKTTKQHIARVDIEDAREIERETEDKIIRLLERKFKETRPKIISVHDYKKGFLTKRVFEKICEISFKNNIPIFADLKQETFAKFRKLITQPDIFYLKPNRNESAETAKLLNGFDKNGNTDEEIIEIAKIIQKEVPINIVITRGKKGAVLFEIGKGPYFARIQEVEEQFDVAGAGDTVEAFLIAGYLGGAKMKEALEISVAASQVAIRKFGTSVVLEEELYRQIKASPLKV